MLKKNLYNTLIGLYIIKSANEKGIKVTKKLFYQILSYIKGEKIPSISLDLFLNYLLTKEFVKISREGTLEIMETGDALLDSLRGEIQSEINSVNALLSKILENKEIIQNLERELFEHMVSQGKRVTEVMPEEYERFISNANLLEIDEIEEEMYKHTYVFPSIIADDNKKKYRLINQVKRLLFQDMQIFSVIKNSGTELIIFTFDNYDNLKTILIKDVMLKRKNVSKVSVDENLLLDVIHELIKLRLKEKGLTYCGGNLFVDYNHKKAEYVQDAGVLSIYDGFVMKIEQTKEKNKFILWIDPVSKVLFSVIEYLEYLYSNGLSNREIVKTLEDIKTVRTIPYGKKMYLSIEGIDLTNKDVHNTKISGLGVPFYTYWIEEHGIELLEFQPIFKVKSTETAHPVEYPAQMLYLDRDVVKELFELSEKFYSGALPPQERFTKTQQIIAKYFSNVFSLSKKVSFRISDQLLTWKKLSEMLYFRSAYLINPPNLKFFAYTQRDDIVNDPRALFRYGPYSGPKKVLIHSIIYPRSLSKETISDFINQLSSIFSQFKFGTLVTDETVMLTIDEKILETKSSKYHINNIVKRTPKKIEGESSIAIIILPRRLRHLRVLFKDSFARVNEIPVQVVMESTIKKYIKTSVLGILKHLCIQIYTKILKFHEALWILERPADSSNDTLYVGIGFSQRPLKDTKANSFAALCDAKGEKLVWEALKLPFQGRYITEDWFDNVLGFIADNLKSEHKRIVLYRIGIMYQSEFETVTRVIDKSNFGDRKIRFDFVTILEDIKRVYFKKNGDIKNPPYGLAITLSEREALIYLSYIRDRGQEGTAIPIKLRIFSLHPSNDGVLPYLQEYNDLCYLNWVAPMTLSKYPIIVSIAKKIANMVSEYPYISEKVFKWLPL